GPQRGDPPRARAAVRRLFPHRAPVEEDGAVLDEVAWPVAVDDDVAEPRLLAGAELAELTAVLQVPVEHPPRRPLLARGQPVPQRDRVEAVGAAGRRAGAGELPDVGRKLRAQRGPARRGGGGPRLAEPGAGRARARRPARRGPGAARGRRL